MLLFMGEGKVWLFSAPCSAFVSRSVPIPTVLEYSKPCVSVQSCIWGCVCLLVIFHTSRYLDTDNMHCATFYHSMLRRYAGVDARRHK